MDRPTTGRRRVRAGSVHVTELIDKRVRQSGAPASSATPRSLGPPRATVRVLETTEPATDVPAPFRRPPSRGSQLAKLAGLGAATLVLCTAIAAATTISHERAGQHAVADRPVPRITGDQALLPDRLDRTLPSAPAPAVDHRPTGQRTAPAEHPRTQPSVTPVSSTTEAPASVVEASVEPTQDPVGDTISDVALVERFYELLPGDPDRAFGLIAPDLLSTTLGEFLDSWASVTGIDVVDVRRQAAGVLAEVRMTLADGHHLKIEQLLTVADSPRRITGVQLLSAQRN
ncbi:hypothetical protein [Actinophytocola gossypii]|uniref:SnoaL-like domain-containing protein n=1 Tax=Actinophytocola gossypii TaxID=2812003 RepID=A0ABT2JJR8_9PSEU|nr:hypothetical protein [Actinophytocola gossypii]MCT2588135.1 hypothetical protein [Actinophytocola gossypii]